MNVITSIVTIMGVLIVYHMDMELHAAPVGDIPIDNVVNSELNVNSLIAMGMTLDKPLLKLIGRTLENMVVSLMNDIDNKTTFVLDKLGKEMVAMEQTVSDERTGFIEYICPLHFCTDWSEWTACSARVIGTFGASTRSRTCGTNQFGLCTNVSKDSTTEIDAKVCEASWCPKNYTITTNGFCISLYNTERKTWKEAQAECNECGGSLININSDMTAKDVDDSLQKMSYTAKLWLDGTRSLPNGEWRYEYDTAQPTYSNWHGLEPNNHDDCRAYVYHGNGWVWFGKSCRDIYNFLCEIV